MAIHERRRRCAVRSVMMRAGTSKGLFFRREDLPANVVEWSPIILGAMGSLDTNDLRQLNGVGGGSSTTSKVAVVARSKRPNVDVDYTFIQVPVGRGKLDFSGNCGNMVSGVGPFAVDEGMVMTEPGASKADVRIFNTNTGRLIIDTVELDETGLFEPNGDCRIGGFGGTGSRIDVSFVEPAGSMTRKLLPTGQPEETLCIDFGASVGKHDVRVTLLDAANPFVFVDQSSLPQNLPFSPDSVHTHAWVEQIRRAGAVRYGLAPTVEDAAKVRGTPKIAFLQPPEAGIKQDIRVQSYSMGKPHPSLQLTGAVCLAAALCVPGTVAQRLSRASTIAAEQAPPTPPESEDGTRDHSDVLSEAVQLSQKQERKVLVGHPTGQIEVTVGWQLGLDGEVTIPYAKVFRTARRIFAGEVIVDLACDRQTSGEEAV